jgi:hypothetical protein
MRVSAKVDYALRAAPELAAGYVRLEALEDEAASGE